MRASLWLHIMGTRNLLNASGAIYMTKSTPTQRYLETASIYIVVHPSKATSRCSTLHRPPTMHQATIPDVVECTAISYAAHHGGGVGQQDTIVYLWTTAVQTMIPSVVCWSLVSYFFSHSGFKGARTPVLWLSGSYLPVMSRTPRQECGL